MSVHEEEEEEGGSTQNQLASASLHLFLLQLLDVTQISSRPWTSAAVCVERRENVGWWGGGVGIIVMRSLDTHIALPWFVCVIHSMWRNLRERKKTNLRSE